MTRCASLYKLQFLFLLYIAAACLSRMQRIFFVSTPISGSLDLVECLYVATARGLQKLDEPRHLIFGNLGDE